MSGRYDVIEWNASEVIETFIANRWKSFQNYVLVVKLLNDETKRYFDICLTISVGSHFSVLLKMETWKYIAHSHHFTGGKWQLFTFWMGFCYNFKWSYEYLMKTHASGFCRMYRHVCIPCRIRQKDLPKKATKKNGIRYVLIFLGCVNPFSMR